MGEALAPLGQESSPPPAGTIQGEILPATAAPGEGVVRADVASVPGSLRAGEAVGAAPIISPFYQQTDIERELMGRVMAAADADKQAYDRRSAERAANAKAIGEQNAAVQSAIPAGEEIQSGTAPSIFEGTAFGPGGHLSPRSIGELTMGRAAAIVDTVADANRRGPRRPNGELR